MIKNNTPFIFRGDGFELDYANYHSDKRFENFSRSVNNRTYTSKETNLTYRILNHWASFGILPEGAQVTEGWHKFTMLELIWLRACVRLREFGVPLESLEAIKKRVMFYSDQHKQYLLFEYYIAKAWFSDADPHVVVLANNKADIATLREITLSRIFAGNFDMLLISLKSVLEEVGVKPVKAKDLYRLTDEEEDLLASIRLKDNKEIKVTLDDKNHITGIEEIKEEINPEAINEAYKEMKKDNSYGEVQTKYVKGKPVAQKISKKQKYNPKES